MQASIGQASEHIRNVSTLSGYPHIMVGGKPSLMNTCLPRAEPQTETGWPADGGTDWGDAHAGTLNQEKYWQDTVCPLLASGLDIYWFEAFDEPGKPSERGNDARHWGLFTEGRTPKFNIVC